MRMKIRPERPRLPRPPRPRRSNSSTSQHTVSQSRLPRLHSRYISDDDDTDSRRHSIASNLAEDGDNASLSSNLSYSNNNDTKNFAYWGRIVSDDTMELAKEIREEMEDIRKIITDDNSNQCNYSIASKLVEDGDNQTIPSTQVSDSEMGYNCGAFNGCGSNPICCNQEDGVDNILETQQELIQQEIDTMKQMMEHHQELSTSLHVLSDGTQTPPPSPVSDGGLIDDNIPNGEGGVQNENNGQTTHNTKTTVEGIFQSDYWSDLMLYGSNLCISWNHHERKTDECYDDSDVVSDITTATPIELSWNDDYCRCGVQFEPIQLLALPNDLRRRRSSGGATKSKHTKSNTGPKQNGKSGHISPMKLPRLKSPLRGGRSNNKPPKAKVIRVKGDDGKNLYQV